MLTMQETIHLSDWLMTSRGLCRSLGCGFRNLDEPDERGVPKSIKARRKARVKAAKMGVLFTRNAEGMLLRAACMENGVVIQGDKRSGRWNRGGRGRDRRAPDRMMGDDLDVDSEGSFDDYEDLPEDMDIDIVNPNEDI